MLRGVVGDGAFWSGVRGESFGGLRERDEGIMRMVIDD